MSKMDFKKEFKELYSSSSKEVNSVKVPPMKYLMIDGFGNPNNSDEFNSAVESLYSIAYNIKFSIKKANLAPDYTVMPLEGLWWADDMSQFSVETKDVWNWTLMIMQPKFISDEIFKTSVNQVLIKKKLAKVADIRLELYDEGLSAQIMHLGPYSDEAPTVAKLHDYITNQGYVFGGKHHEIYLSDPRKAAPEKMKTIIRQPMKA